MSNSVMLVSPSGKWMIAAREIEMAFETVDKLRAEGSLSAGASYRDRLSSMVGALVGVMVPVRGWTLQEAAEQVDEELVGMARVALRTFEALQEDESDRPQWPFPDTRPQRPEKWSGNWPGQESEAPQ